MLPFSPPSRPAKRKHFATSPLVVLYIIRHGESTGNRQGILQGQRDYPLTDTGRQQAQETGRRLRQDASLQDLETGDVSCFFDRIYSSDLTRAKNTAEIIVEELTGGKRKPSKDPSHHGSNDTSSNTRHNDDNANDTGLESLLTLDTDLREISGGAREGQPLGLSLQEAMRRTALKQGIPLEQLQHMPSETLHSLHCRARSFVRRVLTAAAEMQAGGEREEKCTADLVKVENRGREGAPEAEGQRGPTRVLLVSHGGLLLQMFQKVFKFCTVQKVLNASISVVEAYPLAGSNNLANNERQEGKGGAKEGEEQDSQADTCQLASDALSSLGTEDGKKGQGNEGGKVEGLEEEFIFQARSLNDVAHLQASGLVTSRSTAL